MFFFLFVSKRLAKNITSGFSRNLHGLFIALNKYKKYWSDSYLSKCLRFLRPFKANKLIGTAAYILDNPEIDMICQNEYQDENGKFELNTGYLLVRNNDKTKDFFNPNNYIGKYNNDQNYVNNMKSKLNIHVLENDKFPNGKYFYEIQPKTPYIIHFNFVKGLGLRSFL